MRVALDKDNNRIFADSGIRYKEYFCQVCGAPMIYRAGQKNIPHFAHKVKADCPDDKDNKSEWHRHMQGLFPLEANEVAFQDKANDRKFIADVYLKDSNTVIEFQHSPIPVEDFKGRTEFHLSEGRRVIWVFDVSNTDSQECYLKFYSFYRDKQHQMFLWKRNHGIALSSMFGEQADDQDKRVSICLYCGGEGDIVHRIIAHADNYDRIMLSVHPFSLVNINVDEFFYEELRWANPEEWFKRIEEQVNILNQNNQKRLHPVTKHPKRWRL